MSQIEFREGRIKEVAIEEKTFKDKVNHISREYDIPVKTLVYDIEDDDRFMDTEQFTYINGRMFEVLDDQEIDESDDICDVEEIGVNEYSYRLRYYNGGTGFDEMLEDGLNNLTNK